MKKLWNKLKENSEKNIYRLMLFAVVCSMIPIWYLGRYAVPSLDDYYFGIMPHHAWLNTHSIAEVLKGACDMVKFYFFAKQATFSSVFLMALQPGVINEKWYFVTPLIMTGMIIGSISLLIHTIFEKCLEINNKYLVGTVNLLMIFLIIQTMLVPLEGIYWYNGSLHYVFMNSVLYFEIAVILTYLTSEKKKIGLLVIASLLGIVVGGGNLITGLQACVLIMLYVLLIVMQWIADKKDSKFLKAIGIYGFSKAKFAVFIPQVITVIAFMINITAPGNAKRQSMEEQMNPIKAIIESFYWGTVHAISWIEPMTILVFAIIAVIVWKLLKNNSKRFIHPILLALISYGVFAAMFTPTFYAASMDAPDRVKNIIGIAENVLILLNIVNGFGYVNSDKCAIGKEDIADINEKTSSTPYNCKDKILSEIFDATAKKSSSIIFVGLILMAAMFLFAENKNTYTSISAIRSIAIGDAARYYEQSFERFEVYNDESKPDVKVYPITDDAKPYLLFKEDIGNEGEDGYWQNIEISEYYSKNSIVVIRE